MQLGSLYFNLLCRQPCAWHGFRGSGHGPMGLTEGGMEALCDAYLTL